PTSRAHAAAMVGGLTRGPPHSVTTAWALARIDQRRVYDETTVVTMRPLSAPQLEAYLDSEQWRDKAGGYGIQDYAGGFVTRIEGSYSNVVGLPLAQVLAAAEELTA
ncbi:MAG: Maf family protein, partial [Myxococcota bacterium]